MIVSMQMAVLPVLRSPMMSSRWPRPMGVIESMALIPVCIASPTGTDRIEPVAVTSPPSSSWVSSPRTTVPMDSSSRLSASPRMPPSNSSSSFTAALGSPETCAMPSPRLRMRPTWVALTPGW